MKFVTVFFLLLVFSVMDFSSSQSASASSPKGGASASAPKASAPKAGASAPKAGAPKASAPKAGASAPKAGAPKASAPKAGASAPKTGASASAPKLPSGYEISGKSKGFIMAVKLNDQKVTWNEARKACYHEGNGAFLAYAETKEEEDMYLKTMKDKKVNDVWVGIHDLFESNGEYSTVRGEVAKEAAHYTWYPGEPNSNNGPEPCGEYRIAHGKKGLNDRKCDKKFAYMCKIKMPQPKK